MDDLLGLIDAVKDYWHIILPCILVMIGVIFLSFYVKFVKKFFDGVKEIFTLKGFIIVLITILILLYLLNSGTI